MSALENALGEPRLRGVSKLLGQVFRPTREWLDGIGRWSAAIATGASVVAAGLVLAAAYVLLDDVSDAYQAIQFAATNERLSMRADAIGLTLAEARSAQWRGLIFAVVWGLVGASLFHMFWRRCWHVGPAVNPAVLKGIAVLPLAGAGVAVVERVVTLFGLVSVGDQVQLRTGFGPTIVSLAWAKWVLGGLVLFAIVAMLVSALTAACQRGLREDLPFAATVFAPSERRPRHQLLRGRDPGRQFFARRTLGARTLARVPGPLRPSHAGGRQPAWLSALPVIGERRRVCGLGMADRGGHRQTAFRRDAASDR